MCMSLVTERCSYLSLAGAMERDIVGNNLYQSVALVIRQRGAARRPLRSLLTHPVG